jgi:hypothetical protein
VAPAPTIALPATIASPEDITPNPRASKGHGASVSINSTAEPSGHILNFFSNLQVVYLLYTHSDPNI